MAGKIYVGASGWNYKHWMNGAFYPEGLKQSEWLEFYAERFGTVELNNSFYRLPPPETFAAWAKRTPADFAVKVARAGRDVYVYYNNDAHAYALKNAFTMIDEIDPKYLARAKRA